MILAELHQLSAISPAVSTDPSWISPARNFHNLRTVMQTPAHCSPGRSVGHQCAARWARTHCVTAGNSMNSTKTIMNEWILFTKYIKTKSMQEHACLQCRTPQSLLDGHCWKETRQTLTLLRLSASCVKIRVVFESGKIFLFYVMVWATFTLMGANYCIIPSSLFPTIYF